MKLMSAPVGVNRRARVGALLGNIRESLLARTKAGLRKLVRNRPYSRPLRLERSLGMPRNNLECNQAQPPLRDGVPMPERMRATAVIILGVTISALDGTIINLALPAIAKDLNSSAADAIWVISAYNLAALTLLLPCAAMGDRIGHKWVYLAGVGVFAVASGICFMATSVPMLALARGAQGLGAAGIMAVNGALLRQIFPRRLFGRAIAMNSGIIAAASTAGPSVAAAVMSVASWPWLFAANILLGILLISIGWRALPYAPKPPAERHRLAVQDVLLNVLTFGLVFLGAQSLAGALSHDVQPSSLAIPVGLLVTGLVFGTFYVRRQRGLPMPLFPVDLLRIPLFRLSMCTSVATFAAQTLAYVALPFLMLGLWGRSAVEAGLVMSSWPFAILFVAPLAGMLIGRYPGGLLGAVGLALLTTGLTLLASLDGVPTLQEIVWRMALCGIGFGLFQSPNNHTIFTAAPSSRSGAAGGMLGTARLTGQALGAVLLALIFTLNRSHPGDSPLMALSVAAGLAALACVFSALRIRHT
jgi:DHA2 family multidrug resistance protein-like MFS transporter